MDNIIIVTKQFFINDETASQFTDMQYFFTVYFYELGVLGKISQETTFNAFVTKIAETRKLFQDNGKLMHMETSFSGNSSVTNSMVFKNQEAYDEYSQFLISEFGTDFNWNFQEEKVGMTTEVNNSTI